MALLDGALLALAHPDDFPAAVKEYEREKFERTGAAARMSARNAELAGPRPEDARLLPTGLTG